MKCLIFFGILDKNLMFDYEHMKNVSHIILVEMNVTSLSLCTTNEPGIEHLADGVWDVIYISSLVYKA